MKVAEMFSGIGSQAKALKKVFQSKNEQIEIVKTCEWNIHAIVAYNLIHNKSPLPKWINELKKNDLVSQLSNYSLSFDGASRLNLKNLKNLNDGILKQILYSIITNKNLVNIKEVKGENIPNDLDLLTYSFPCQDLSNVGSLHGYKDGIDRNKDSRSGLLWEIERILEEKEKNKEKMPKFLLLENVTSLEAKRHLGNFQSWQNKLKNLGYINKIYKLNSQDFGIPQYRKRLLMLSVYVGDNYELINKINNYWEEHDLNNQEYIKTLQIKNKSLNEILKLDYTNEKYYKEALQSQPNATPSRMKIWDQNYKIVNEFHETASKVQTITTKQDRHPNSGNIYFNVNNNKSKFRFLSPRECFLLMGFEEEDFESIIKNELFIHNKFNFFSRDILYKLAGNSIVINVLEQIFTQVYYIKKICFQTNNDVF